jgi:hypothetical protein
LSTLTWLAIHAIAKVAPTSGELSPATLTAALDAAKDVDLLGVIPPWTPSTKGGDPFVRISNPQVYAEKIVDGHLVLASPDAFDVRSAMGV